MVVPRQVRLFLDLLFSSFLSTFRSDLLPVHHVAPLRLLLTLQVRRLRFSLWDVIFLDAPVGTFPFSDSPSHPESRSIVSSPGVSLFSSLFYFWRVVSIHMLDARSSESLLLLR